MTIDRMTRDETRLALNEGVFILNRRRYTLRDANVYALLVLERRIDYTHSITLPLSEGNDLLALQSVLTPHIKRAKEEIISAGKTLPYVATIKGRREPVDYIQLMEDATRVNTNHALIKSMGKPKAKARKAYNVNRVGKFICACGCTFYRPYYRLNQRAREGYVFCSQPCRYKFMHHAVSEYRGQGYLSKENVFTPIAGEGN